jgi:uncharacterized protein YyaL (SSP411 family)
MSHPPTQASSPAHHSSDSAPNHLAGETSPYLRQHLYNPVDWYPYGPDALAKAKNEGKLIFLSIGYSACHWCHVMAHESFESPRIAQILNQYYVAIKVDREERPDLDTIYQTVVQALGRSGGWPLSVWLTPEGQPFFGGTYFPPTPRYGMIGFGDILLRMVHLYETQRQDVEASAIEISRVLKDVFEGAPMPYHPESASTQLNASFSAEGEETAWFSPTEFEKLSRSLLEEFDRDNGGFGDAPKFPNFPALTFLMRQIAEKPEGFGSDRLEKSLPSDLVANLRTQIQLSLDQMHSGGIYDHLGGGFHRYSVDAHWSIPHFEKMLYDNAVALVTYAEASRIFNSDKYAQIVREILAWLNREMRDPKGAFYATLDADSDGKEGVYYAWTMEELRRVIPDAQDRELFFAAYGVTSVGNFEHGQTVLHISRTPAELATKLNIPIKTVEARLALIKTQLLELRAKRVSPHRDEKILTDWNALLVHGLLTAAKALRGGDLATNLERTAFEIYKFLRYSMFDQAERRLYHVYTAGERKITGFLDDYAYLLQATLDIFEARHDPGDWAFAEQLSGVIQEEFWDASQYIFYFQGRTGSQLGIRTKSFADMPLPNPIAVMAENLAEMYDLTGLDKFRNQADHILNRIYPSVLRNPQPYATALLALQRLVYNSTQITVVLPQKPTPGTETELNRVRTEIFSHYIPRLQLAVGSRFPSEILAFRGKTPHESQILVYICIRSNCFASIADVEKLREFLHRFFLFSEPNLQ